MVIQNIIYAIHEELLHEYMLHFNRLSDYTNSMDKVTYHKLFRDRNKVNEFILVSIFESEEIADNWYESHERATYLKNAGHCFKKLISFHRYNVSSVKNMEK